MKSHINLFSYHKQSNFYIILYGQIKKYAQYSLVFAILYLAVTQVLIFSMGIRKDSLEKEKNIVIANLKTKEQAEEEIVELLSRKEMLSNFLAEDSNFYDYYLLVQNIIITYLPQLTSISIDNEQKTDISLVVDQDKTLSNFLQVAESELFLQHFDDFTLRTIKLIEQEGKKVYVLDFSGKFKHINETDF